MTLEHNIYKKILILPFPGIWQTNKTFLIFPENIFF